jgi:hypothetical protein
MLESPTGPAGKIRALEKGGMKNLENFLSQAHPCAMRQAGRCG